MIKKTSQDLIACLEEEIDLLRRFCIDETLIQRKKELSDAYFSELFSEPHDHILKNHVQEAFLRNKEVIEQYMIFQYKLLETLKEESATYARYSNEGQMMTASYTSYHVSTL